MPTFKLLYSEVRLHQVLKAHTTNRQTQSQIQYSNHTHTHTHTHTIITITPPVIWLPNKECDRHNLATGGGYSYWPTNNHTSHIGSCDVNRSHTIMLTLHSVMTHIIGSTLFPCFHLSICLPTETLEPIVTALQSTWSPLMACLGLLQRWLEFRACSLLAWYGQCPYYCRVQLHSQ